jgi:ElaB/YqjD/DUF883 family membrane-anchored ribosome-binding protein
MIQERQPSPEGESQRPGEEIPDKAEALFDAARKRGRGLLDRQKRAAVEELSSVAGVMRDAASKFEEKQEEGVGDYVRKAADYVESLSSTLNERDLEDLLQQGERMLRERPALSLGVTAGAGFVIGRFLRASSQRVARDLRSKKPGTQEDAGMQEEGMH